MPPSPPPKKTPWASVVRGGDSENSSPTAAEVEGGLSQEVQSNESLGSTKAQGEANDGRSARPVWNRTNNVAVEAGGSVMGGAVAWPALSESARTGGSRPLVADGSSTQPPILPQPPQRPANNNGTHGNSTGNTSASNNRQRSRNRGSGGGGGNRPSAPIAQPPPPPPPPPPAFPIYERPYFMRSQRPAGGSQSQLGSEHSPSQRNNSRRGNYNARPRGDGSFYNNQGNRRDQDRRGFQAQLPLYMHPHPVGYMPPPPPPLPLAAAAATPFMVPQPIRAFPGIFGVEMPQGYVIPSMPPDPYRPAMPPHSPPPPPSMLYSPGSENSLASLILNQINYYFSDYNLAGDDFLRSNMDDHGWVPISLIASFRRVRILTNEIPVILDAVRDSPLLEIQGDKIRRRDNWSKWLPSVFNSGSSQESEAALSTPMQNKSLDQTGEENNVVGIHNRSRLENGGMDASEADHSISE